MKNQNIRNDQRGIAHLLLICIVALILVLGAGIAFIRYSQNKTKTQQARQELQRQKQQAEEAQLKAAQQKKLAEKTTETPPTSKPAVTPAGPAECNRAETRYVTAKDSLSVRPEKSSASKALIFAPYGAAMRVGCLDGDWYSSEYQGKVGYSLKAYLSATKPETTAPSTPTASSSPAHPTSCAPNNADFTVYASVSGGTPTYWRDNRSSRSPLALIPYGQAMTVHCYPDDNIQNMVYEDFWVSPNDVTTTKP